MLCITNIYYFIIISLFIHEEYHQYNTIINSSKEESVKLNIDTNKIINISKNNENENENIDLTDPLEAIYYENSDGINYYSLHKKCFNYFHILYYQYNILFFIIKVINMNLF